MDVGWQNPDDELLDELELLLDEDEPPGSGALGHSARVTPPLHSASVQPRVQLKLIISSKTPWPGAGSTRLIWLAGVLAVLRICVLQLDQLPVGGNSPESVLTRRPFSYTSTGRGVVPPFA
jgi:hypothetical protein